jgi:hypothetical protein
MDALYNWIAWNDCNATNMSPSSKWTKKFAKIKNKIVNRYQNQSTCSICHQNYLFPYKQNKNLNLVQTQHAYWILINLIEIHFKQKQQNCNFKLLICLN